MLTVVIPAQEAYNESTGRFVNTKEYTLKLEHSLLSLQKWESKHHKYFLDNENLTIDEIIDYVRCMTINQVDDQAYDCLTKENINEIKNYLKDPMTATWFSEDPNKPKSNKKEIVTAECIYSSMIMLGIPVELFEKRHLNHLVTLIRVCNENQNPEQHNKKTNPYDTLRRYSEINKARKAKLGTKG